MHRPSNVYKPKTVQNSSKQVCVWILMWETTGDCYAGESNIMDRGLIF